MIHESLIGDANRVKQVLLNLITNAVKYTPDNGIIRVTDRGSPMGKGGLGLLPVCGGGQRHRHVRGIYEAGV